jgi:quercetin dioxygenase-like cupin family protein
MHVNRISDVSPYNAPGHFDMRGLRLQGREASPCNGFWVGLSYFLPGGGADADAGDLERVYVVIDGSVTVTTNDDEVVLQPLDSCWLAAGERRSIVNNTNRPATMLVVIPNPEVAR